MTYTEGSFPPRKWCQLEQRRLLFSSMKSVSNVWVLLSEAFDLSRFSFPKVINMIRP